MDAASAQLAGTTLTLDAAGATHVGGRDHNEDAVLVRPDLGVFLVADGAGGHNSGNVASALVTSVLADHFKQTADQHALAPRFDALGLWTSARRLSLAIHRANREILHVQSASSRHEGMGSTVVAVCPDCDARVVHVGHLGDSRCYRLRAGRLEQLTADHTLINDVLELAPDLDEARGHKLPRNVITQALGMIQRVRPAIRTFAVARGDTYLLCSDGLTGALDEADIQGLLAQDAPAQEIADDLVALALEANPSDNVSAVVLRFPQEPGAPHAEQEPEEVMPAPEPPPAFAAEASDIEILMVDSESPEDSSPELLVVPTDDIPESLRRALHGVVVPMKPTARPAIDTLPHTDVGPCPRCQTVVELTTTWCPHCGAAMPKPFPVS